MDVLPEQALATLAAAGRRLADETSLDKALSALADAAAEAARAEVAVVRVVDESGRSLQARAIAAGSDAVAAELVGSRFSLLELPFQETADVELMPAQVRAAAVRARADSLLLLPAWADGRRLGSLELMRSGDPFGHEEIAVARLASVELGLVLRALHGGNGTEAGTLSFETSLALAGDALAAGYDPARIGDQVVRVAVTATGALAARLWLVEDGSPKPFVDSEALDDVRPSDTVARAAHDVLSEHEAVMVRGDDADSDRTLVVSMRMGQPPLAVLQLFFPAQSPPGDALLRRLSSFGVRAAHALQAGRRAGEAGEELGRMRALLAVLGQAIARLSLSHTLGTAADQVSELLHAERVAIYLRDEGRLQPAYERGLAGPHVAVAERMLELALGPLRTQGILEVNDAAADLRLAGVRDAVLEAGIEAALAVPLLVHEELIGLLAVYVPAELTPTENERTLFSAFAAQLAVAVQNARLHEDVKRLAADRERALDLEAARSRELAALHEISSSFAESLRLDATLDAVAKSAVELLGVDAAVIRMHDPGGGHLVPMAAHVSQPRLEEALKPILEQPQDTEGLPGRRLFRMGRALVLDPDSASRLGASYELLVPFLEQGSTAAVVPIATPAELLATMTIVSLDPGRRIGDAAVELALSVATQAALAIDNARLYQQQKDFADTMQRSLLPQELPSVPGLELGAVYESSARVEVGGDVYDFLLLPDGRLVAVLGDVAGHGIAATADMALAKFVFRSLAREHPEPSEFLAHANEVAHDELTGGNFITMICLTVDPAAGEVAAASAGHPSPRVLASDGSVTPLAPRGLALGVETNQTYEAVHTPLAAGCAVCLYTDGILEARRGRELYGERRLDAALGAGSDLSAQALAEYVVADCRAFAGADLADDCAVVVVRRA
ncbi:MAG TPA: SpoIIE family protein phosphatase [Gaiellaceae bacterium]|nr:SpoIIE family protein phosphatase [Gaiellaceae bacterium]